MYYIVHLRGEPVFLLDARPLPNLDDTHTRARADAAVRGRVGGLVRGFVVPKLYGVSAMGMRWVVHEYRKATNSIVPHAVVRDYVYVTDVAPVERWELELLDEAEEG